VPENCKLPHTASATCVDGQCVPVTCEDGFGSCDGVGSNGCEAALVIAFRDADGDGFGDPAQPTLACPTAGYVANQGDCYDGNPDAHPGQTAFFATARGDGSYDYDCSGDETRRFPRTQQYCLCTDFACSIDEGWIATVPGCGAEGSWALPAGGLICEPIPEGRTQACR
jgi:hypothetical protein